MEGKGEESTLDVRATTDEESGEKKHCGLRKSVLKAFYTADSNILCAVMRLPERTVRPILLHRAVVFTLRVFSDVAWSLLAQVSPILVGMHTMLYTNEVRRLTSSRQSDLREGFVGAANAVLQGLQRAVRKKLSATIPDRCRQWRRECGFEREFSSDEVEAVCMLCEHFAATWEADAPVLSDLAHFDPRQSGSIELYCRRVKFLRDLRVAIASGDTMAPATFTDFCKRLISICPPPRRDGSSQYMSTHTIVDYDEAVNVMCEFLSPAVVDCEATLLAVYVNIHFHGNEAAAREAKLRVQRTMKENSRLMFAHAAGLRGTPYATPMELLADCVSEKTARLLPRPRGLRCSLPDTAASLKNQWAAGVARETRSNAACYAKAGLNALLESPEVVAAKHRTKARIEQLRDEVLDTLEPPVTHEDLIREREANLQAMQAKLVELVTNFCHTEEGKQFLKNLVQQHVVQGFLN